MSLKTHYESLYIGGSWVKPKGSEVYTVINPATEEAIGEVPVGTAADADAAIAAAREAFDKGPWPRMDWRERAVILQQFHDALVARKDEIVQLCVAEAGSIIPVANIMQFDMALDGLQYDPTADWNGSDTLTITTTDGEMTDTIHKALAAKALLRSKSQGYFRIILMSG